MTIKYNNNNIFVFGSNELGIHKRGAAKFALDYCEAILGKGHGLQGYSYAIPTKKTPYITLSLEKIKKYVDIFREFALNNSHINFHITPIGTGLAGYKHTDIAPMFKNMPTNCFLPLEWIDLNEKRYNK